MKEGIHLSQALQAEKPKYYKGRLNLIHAQTGQGKTTAAVHTIPTQLGLQPQRCLILIDTNMGENEKIELEECQEWGGQLNKPYILNYQKFGSMIRKGQITPEMFDYVACDEIHNLVKYVRIDEATIWNRNPDSEYELICLLLTHESLSYVALDTLFNWAELHGIWWFGLTATADSLEKWPKIKKYIHRIQIHEQLVAYEVYQKYSYTNISTLLSTDPEVKRLIFAPTIELGEKFAQEIRANTDRNVMCLWSQRAAKPLGPNQLELIAHLQKEHNYPQDLDDIIATEAYATGWNLVDDNVQIVIVHSGNKDIQIQFPGRKRGDWQIQYNYDSKEAESKKRIERFQKTREEIASQSWVIPEEYLGKKLLKEDKENLLKLLNYPKKWTSFKKDIEKYYEIEQTGTGRNYGHIIKLKDS